ncbi:MAG: GGDEF domain-containing protein [Venatoribacter sp.]
MRIDIGQDELLPRLQVVVYLLAAVAVSGLIYDQYLQGLYSLVLSNAIAIPIFLFSAFFIFLKRNQHSYRHINYALISLLAALALYQLPHYPDHVAHYLYAFPLFCFFALPIAQATVINLLVWAVVVVIMWLTQDFYSTLRISTNYALLLGSSWCFAYLTLVKSWSLQRLALTDRFSGAYNYRHFYNMLEREKARSHAMHKQVSLIGIEIEDYEQLQSIHGSRVMSQFLPLFVDEVHQLTRAGDEIFRLTESLFVLVLPICPEAGAQSLMERIKSELEQRSWEPFNELVLGCAAIGVHLAESSQEAEKRLFAKMQKKKVATLQIAAFK